MPLQVSKPQPGDYLPYYETYISLVPDEGDHLALFAEQESNVATFFGDLTEEQAEYRYADGKWCLKEMLGHMTDGERMQTYRLMCVARGDTTPLPRNTYDVRSAGFDGRPVGELLGEFQAVRQATIALLRSLTVEQLQRAGTVGDGRVTAASLVYFVAGHTKHHMNIVRERYAPGIRQ